MSKGCLKFFMVSATHNREDLLTIIERSFHTTFSIDGVIYNVSDVVDMVIRQQSGKSAVVTLKSKKNSEEWNHLIYQLYIKMEGRDIVNRAYRYQYITDLDIYLKGINAWMEAIRLAIPDIQVVLQNDNVNKKNKDGREINN